MQTVIVLYESMSYHSPADSKESAVNILQQGCTVKL